MMAIAFDSKKEAKAALPFGEEKIIETSMFGPEFKDGYHAVVVSKRPSVVRKSFAEIWIENGKVVKLK